MKTTFNPIAHLVNTRGKHIIPVNFEMSEDEKKNRILTLNEAIDRKLIIFNGHSQMLNEQLFRKRMREHNIKINELLLITNCCYIDGSMMVTDEKTSITYKITNSQVKAGRLIRGKFRYGKANVFNF